MVHTDSIFARPFFVYGKGGFVRRRYLRKEIQPASAAAEPFTSSYSGAAAAASSDMITFKGKRREGRPLYDLYDGKNKRCLQSGAIITAAHARHGLLWPDYFNGSLTAVSTIARRHNFLVKMCN